jgi:transposase
MSEPFDPSRSLTALEQDSTVIAVIEMSQSSWLVAAVIPGVERQPFKKLDPDEEALLKLLHRWRNEASRAGREIKRIVVAYEAGRDGFWLARWLRTRDVEAYVVHPTSVAVSREHRRAKTDRLDTELLKRAFLRLAARRAASLQHGGDSDGRGGGRAAAEPRAGEPGR